MTKLLRRKHVFKLAITEQEIVRVYRIGPESCMKGSNRVAAYAYSDLAVAYLENILTKRIVARAVVWPDKKLYYRIYGSTQAKIRMQHSLYYRGFRHGRLKGAKISMQLGVLPSLDGVRGIIHRGGYAILQ